MYKIPANFYQKIYLMIPIFLFSACSSTDDPGKGGLFGGIHGISSGAYERRVEERERNLEALREIEKETQNEQQALKKYKQTEQQRLDKLNAEVTKLTTQSDELALQIKARQSGTKKAQRKKQKLSQKLKDLTQQISHLKTQLSQVTRGHKGDKDISVYEAEEQRLLKELQQLKKDLYLL